jgi:type I restriction enzyme M protein
MAKLSLAKLERHLYSAADRLRQEGLDAATYKDYIFGLLFLKRCSDVFEAERERIVGRRVEQGMFKEIAETQYGENPDFYDGFFVPERARWDYLQVRLGDATEPYGSVLDKALGALSEANESLEHVLDHISFMRPQGNKRIVSDDACKDLVRHFSRYRLRNEDFQFSDLLGAAYEFLINMFAESAGKKGGDFYTPRDVIRLMVRIIKPRPGLSIYDPTCGSGGMLIISREFVEQSGGDPTNLRLCGQVNDASAWSICKLNVLLHGVPGADIRLEDTLLHPQHREAGELERFDRVIANPPFSQNYTRTNMEYPERFRWGWCPTTGKKGDLMFAQHMLAICKPAGMVITVMPHGVLFRGGEEKKIRQKFLEQDLIEAIIGLPPNLFYGAGIPACILVMRPNLSSRSPNPNKPENRRGQVLFINADAEFHAGRAQNYLRPEHVEKIVSTFDRFEDVPGYARRVPLAQIGDPANDWNLNIRRYVDNSPPPEPHDVRAHLLGGVPVAELEAKRALFDALGFDITHAFARREHDPKYCDFAPALGERTTLRPLVENDLGVQVRADTARLKGEKEAFEQSNAPDDADEEELATWNYAKDLDRQMRELKADNRDALRELAKRERAATRARATAEEKRAAAEAKAALQPVFDQLAALEAALAPYEQIKADLTAARARFRELTDAFVDQLRARCGIMREDEKRALVLELFAQDVQAGLDAAVSERQQELMRFVEGL